MALYHPPLPESPSPNFLSTSSVLLPFFDRSCAILQELRIRALFLLDAPFLPPSVFCRSFFRNRHPFAGQFGRKALVISSPNEAGTPFLLLWHPEGWYLISFAQDIRAFSQAGNAYELPFISRTVSHRFACKSMQSVHSSAQFKPWYASRIMACISRPPGDLYVSILSI
jgi:hypothetical protein